MFYKKQLKLFVRNMQIVYGFFPNTFFYKFSSKTTTKQFSNINKKLFN